MHYLHFRHLFLHLTFLQNLLSRASTRRQRNLEAISPLVEASNSRLKSTHPRRALFHHLHPRRSRWSLARSATLLLHFVARVPRFLPRILLRCRRCVACNTRATSIASSAHRRGRLKCFEAFVARRFLSARAPNLLLVETQGLMSPRRRLSASCSTTTPWTPRRPSMSCASAPSMAGWS